MFTHELETRPNLPLSTDLGGYTTDGLDVQRFSGPSGGAPHARPDLPAKEQSTKGSNPQSFLAHQWSGYASSHRSRNNLLIHIVAIPVFWVANIGFALALLRGAWLLAIVTAALMSASILAQGRGHRMEAIAAKPFTGRLNALARLFTEQWVAFPRFVLTGGWLEALRRS
jgi:hypothetical protein